MKASRVLRLGLAAGLLISLLAATVAPAAAQPDPPSGDPPFVFQDPPAAFAGSGMNVIYYPWVAIGEDFGLGESRTIISVQNLESRDGQIWIYVGDGDNGWSYAATAALSAWASKTFTAGQLGIDGDGAPVAVVGFGSEVAAGSGLPWTGTPPTGDALFTETVVILSNPLMPGQGQEQVFACVANDDDGNPSPFLWALDGAPDLGTSGATYVQATDGSYWVTWTNQTQLQDILDHVNTGATQLINPFGGLNEDGDCNDSLSYSANGVQYNDSLTIGGTAFATATAGDDDAELEQLTTTHTAVSGYNAINGLEVGTFEEWYLPIVQTNCGPGGCWNSIIRVANLAANNSSVEVRFFPADDGSGSLQTGFQIQALVQGGETWNIDLGDYVPEGWVGAAHIYSDGAAFAMVDRYKVGYNMWLTNTGSAANFENLNQFGGFDELGSYALFAPHVLVDYFGWNTGINVANLADEDNNVSIQYFNLLGNATQGLSQRLAPHGMTYFYDPSESGQNWSSQDPATDPNAGVVASAMIWSDYPVAAVVDATKYPETDPRGGADVFQATSYSATQNAYGWQAVPYVTKGNAIDGSGATSGINFMNPTNVAATVDVYWVNPSGFNASNFGTSVVSMPAYANGFVYSLWQHNLPNGFTGAAVAVSRGGVPIVAASANVNYDVEGDGAVIYNGFNPCGAYRTLVTDTRFAQQIDDELLFICEESEIDPPAGTINALLTTEDTTIDPAGLVVELYEGDCETMGDLLDSQEVDSYGAYIFDDLEPGTYCVGVANPNQDPVEVLPADAISVALMPNAGATVTFTLVPPVTTVVVDEAECDNPDNDLGCETSGQAAMTFESGPVDATDDGPPLGDGSIQMSTVAGADFARVMLEEFDGMLLTDFVAGLEELSFWTLIEARDGTCVAPGLVLRLDTDGDNVADERLYFEPCYQHASYGVPGTSPTTVLNEWQQWDAMNGVWWQFTTGTAAPPSSEPYGYLSHWASTLPAGTTIITDPAGTGGGLHLLVGGGGSWSNFVGYADALTITVDGVTTIYDFEP